LIFSSFKEKIRLILEEDYELVILSIGPELGGLLIFLRSSTYFCVLIFSAKNNPKTA